MLAKQLATIDVLSRGRMSLLTVGLGVLPGEAAAAGVDFTTRSRRADEAIDVLRLLLSGDAAATHFQHHQVARSRTQAGILTRRNYAELRQQQFRALVPAGFRLCCT